MTTFDTDQHSSDSADLADGFPSDPAGENFDETPGAGSEHDDAADDESGAGARKAGAAANNRALIRRVAMKTHELGQLDKAKLTLVAHLLGTSTAVPDVAVAVFTAPRSATAAAKDLFDIAEASDMEAAVLAMSIGRPRFRAVWVLLEHLKATKGTLATTDMKAAIEVATAVKGLDPTKRENLRDAVALTKKS